ncbi:MAG: peptidylprolyl isomerase [Crocinitomicaceae bacterium]|jgi:peptidyl-prolyl cis-trans isomerase SurA|nr:peptidylprolyl isomerase [Crocinitomicaceae bacterium]MDP4683884.1 peptidylprolyl isomerase [Crocinitomicaceae bacterium]MDP4865825.1 peptidylprolyl isomerase [Crocinitomicaceae bacterium]MDP5011074.1 peptidylprolyl isomerase [Crocinitomicaceae bacterium]MDP5099536.1 peptidylprolyl isomerase [Crocinitomicaceae bacterium]
MILKFNTISFLFLATISFAQERKVVDKIVAQVGDNIILMSDLEAQKLQAIQAGMAVTKEMDCTVLEELMYNELLLNQAKLDSIEVSDEQVDSEMENRLRVLEEQIGGREKLEQFYGKSVTQIKEEFRPIIKDRLLSQEMERTITADITVTPKEVSDFFSKIPKDSIPLINAQLSFQQIVHYPEITKADKKRAFDQLSEIRKNITGGKSFDTQARIHSMDPGSAAQGGKITASRGMMVPPFEAAVFSLEVGDISDVFESSYGYHIVKLLDRKGDDYVCQHILIIPEYTNDALEFSALKMDSCYALLKENKITWDDAVARFSNDEMTKQNKGIITNPISGEQTWDMEDLNQVDQQIFLLTDNMEKGDITNPNLYVDIYERKQGIRIVRLMDRKPQHLANLKDDYALIKRAAENDKKQRTINNWIKTKIGNAYVRIDESYQDCQFRNPWFTK